MSEEDLKLAFQPFYSNRKGGTGLGLPIVKDIVQVHHGMIDIISQKTKARLSNYFFPSKGEWHDRYRGWRGPGDPGRRR